MDYRIQLIMSIKNYLACDRVRIVSPVFVMKGVRNFVSADLDNVFIDVVGNVTCMQHVITEEDEAFPESNHPTFTCKFKSYQEISVSISSTAPTFLGQEV